MKHAVSSALMLCCLVVVPVLAAPPPEKPRAPGPTTERKIPPAADVVELPPRVRMICARAKGDLAFMCGEFDRAYRELEQHKRAAIAAKELAARKLQQLTNGGIVEVLE